MHEMERRRFMKAGITLGAAGVVGTRGLGRILAAGSATPDIVAVKGGDAFASTLKALQALGGIQRFVGKGAKVGLLINAPAHWRLEGSHTRMEVPLAVAKLCLDAGATEILTLPILAPKFWSEGPLAEKYASVIKAIKPCSDKTVETKIPRGVRLKSGQVRTELLEAEVLINIPVAKHHVGTNFSGNLKNMMGGLARETNRTFHAGASGYEDLELLCQSIADLNTLRKQTLCVVDATVVLATGGPAGPGDLLKPQKVVVGTDPVAVDAYCAGLHGRKPKEMPMLTKAVAAGVGRLDIEKLVVKEIEG
jgi:uncharacterized protein (DUF362 family)